MRLIIFFILLVTIPRYSSAFSDVDTFTIFGLQVAALGEAIAMSLGEWQIMQTIGLCRKVQLGYRAEWEKLHEILEAQGKQTRKRSYIPELQGSVLVMFVFMVVLEVIGIASQVPHFVAKVLGKEIWDILPGLWLWGYISLLVVAPGILQAGLALGQQYKVIAGAYSEDSVESFGSISEIFDKFRSIFGKSLKTSEPVKKNSQDVPKKKKGKPNIAWWRGVYRGMNGNRENMTPELVLGLVENEWEDSPSWRTIENWSKECIESTLGGTGEEN